MPATVSILMPAYRAQTSIPATVASLLAQTRDDWELLLIADDGINYQSLLAACGACRSPLPVFGHRQAGIGRSQGPQCRAGRRPNEVSRHARRR